MLGISRAKYVLAVLVRLSMSDSGATMQPEPVGSMILRLWLFSLLCGLGASALVLAGGKGMGLRGCGLGVDRGDRLHVVVAMAMALVGG